MESSGLLSALRRHLALLLVVTLLGAAVAGIVVALLPPTYAARATLFLRVNATSPTLLARSQFAMQRVQSYPQLLESPSLLQAVADELHLHDSTQQLASRLTSDNPANTLLVTVTATDRDPREAAAIANAAAAALAQNVDQLENHGTIAAGTIALVPQVAATPPAAPASPDPRVVLGLGLVAGFVLAALAALLLERLRPTVRTVEDVRRVTGLPVVAVLPRSGGTDDDAALDAATNLRTLTRGHLPPVLMLAAAGERSSRSAAHLPIADGLAQTGRRVALLASSTDPLDRLGVQDPATAAGLTELLSGTASVEAVLVPVPDRGYDVVAPGDPAHAPDAFELERTAVVALAPLVASRDVVVLQASSKSAPLDLSVAGRIARSALVVVSRDTRVRDLLGLLAELRALEIVPLGVVLTESRVRPDLQSTWSDGDFVRVETEGRPAGAPAALRPDRPSVGADRAARGVAVTANHE
jgi:capsular polysaccharide biosynthesis protein